MSNLLSKTSIEILTNLKLKQILEVEYLFNVYQNANEIIKFLGEENDQIKVQEVNQLELLFYAIGEYHYSVSYLNKEEHLRFIKNEHFANSMASVVADKCLSLSIFNHVERKLANRFSPPASSLNIYINFMLNIVKGYQRNDPQSTLISDLLMKSLTIARSIIEQLLAGYETEAFSSWRTLHECECTLILLD
ncbi:MAG: hypothetical protein GX813_02755 [Erysipelotrichia bacterium]|nr:hypothetical protein [Erysipelotrichia bacterium]